MSIDRTNYNALVDDSGSGTDGSITSKSTIKDVLLDPIDARWSENTTTSTGNQDNFAYSEADVLRCNNATTITLRGLLAPASPAKPGKSLLIVSVGAGSVVINDQDANSTAANRIITGTGAPVTLAAGTGFAWVEYDSTTARWRMVGSSASAVTGQTVQTTTLTGTQNDFAATAARHLVLRCNNASLITFNGFVAGTDGDIIDVISVGAGQVDFNHQNAGSSASNRLINTVTSGKTSLAAGVGTASFVYDGTTARWRLAAHNQGAWIDIAYAGGNFTSDSGTWTVDSGDQSVLRSWVKDRTLFITLILLTTSKSAASADLVMALPYGYTAAATVYLPTLVGNNNAGGLEADYFVMTSTTLIFRRSGGVNWSIATNTTDLRGTAFGEIT